MKKSDEGQILKPKEYPVWLGVLLITLPFWIIPVCYLFEPLNDPPELRTKPSSLYTPQPWERLYPEDYHFSKKESMSGEDGIVLTIKGMDIHTGLSSEELLDEISLDYQDLFDYYGGSEELY